ncbi:type IV pili methyl-accepting chemotaxis transducer N-terminal domain-containing protein [Loktanella agnita]|uniref:type IV pili methyl-accepting chemotaxis transducer N-terminal domain-containing protein n=1 Tax=Loktanella agnita TaxID=287097 RepID=UPI003989AB0A
MKNKSNTQDRSSRNQTRRGSKLLVTAALATTVFTSGPAWTQILDDALYDGGKARVNLSASLRSYSESVAGAGCRVAAGISGDVAEDDLAAYRDRFNRILTGLKNGDTTLGIPTAEENSRSIRTIAMVYEKWRPVNAAAENMVNGQIDAGQLAAISDNYRDLYEQTLVLASEISGQYSNPLELLNKDAVTLDFMTRQRTLLDRMARITCGLATDNPALGTVEELKETLDFFERSLVALRDGFPNVGISPPPNDAVKNALSTAHDHWMEYKPVFDHILAGDAVTEQDVVDVTAFDKQLKVEMDNAITLYLISSPGQRGVYKVPLTAYVENVLSGWLTNPALIAAINTQNAAHQSLTEEQIIALDQDWRAEATAGGGTMISTTLGSAVSTWLGTQQQATAGFVTEVFIMDNRGLNVAQSVETSDYWQGDEAKWQETYGREDGRLHISDVEFDDSTGFYQAQASMPVFDLGTNEKIGAVTFGINVQSLM